MLYRRKMFQNSIFSRLIITFLVILLPVYLLSAAIHKWGVAIIRTQIINSMKSQMDYHKIIFENELDRILNLQYECLSDQELLELANFSQEIFNFDIAKSINRLQNRLYTLKNSSIYIENVKVIIPLIEKTISSENGVSAISDKDKDIINSFSDNNISKLESENNILFSRIRNNSFDNKNIKPRFVLQVQLSNSMLQNTFKTFNSYDGSGALIFYPNKNYLLTTLNDYEITNQITEVITKNNEVLDNYNRTISIGKNKYIVFYKKLSSKNIWIASYIPEKQVFLPLNKYKYLLWIFTIISMFIIAIFSFSTHKFLQRPLKKLVKSFQRVEAGEIKFTIKHNANDEFQYLYTRFNAMLEYINNLIEQVYTQKIMNQKAELKQLQSQINPHFLFNSFFILQRMIQGDDKENAVKFCRFLGQYFQYVTRNAKDEMPLYKEIEHARNYLEIQAIRFSNISIKFEELPKKYENFLVPRLILQPIIENAFEHGFNKKANERLIYIGFKETIEGLYCIVEDNGNNVDEEELSKLNKYFSEDNSGEVESTGLLNINKRIRLKFGGSSGLSVSRGEMGGFKVVIFFENKEEYNV
ncbi:histidine kinase [Clostridium sp. SYSU_GA19001]|uniref:sensor histidine kinase n=1 Tax=Clostridium caldaquaticum TaxID=2940653 RepID=UPI002077888A|nr:histidine kinase [Clostridium caldaquaticum]MCM8711521.1 histidine kinase [Clostridium caldaquaticum]